MNRAKAFFVSLLLALQLAGLLWAAYRLFPRGFMAAALTLAVYGFCCACVGFCRWLSACELLPTQARPRFGSADEPAHESAAEPWEGAEEGER